MKSDFPQAPPWVDGTIFRQKINDFCDTPGVDFETAAAFSVTLTEIGGEYVLTAPTVRFFAAETLGMPSCYLSGHRVLKRGGPTLEAIGAGPAPGLAGTWKRFCSRHDRVRRIFLCPSLYDCMILETFNAHAPETCIFWAEHEPELDDLIFLSKIPQETTVTLVYRGWAMAHGWVSAWGRLAKRACDRVLVRAYEHRTLLGEILTKRGEI